MPDARKHGQTATTVPHVGAGSHGCVARTGMDRDARRLPEATSDTLALVASATAGARRTWRSGYRYSKAGVVKVDLVRLEASQRPAGLGPRTPGRGGVVVVAVDGQPARRGWATRIKLRSPRYLTRVDGWPTVSAE